MPITSEEAAIPTSTSSSTTGGQSILLSRIVRAARERAAPWEETLPSLLRCGSVRFYGTLVSPHTPNIGG
jgi:hypothetical protein